MESIQKKESKIIAKHPLDRKFPSIEEAGQAKIDYIMASKPASYWEKLKKAVGK